MSILLTAFLVVGIILGWIKDLNAESFSYQFMVWSCIATSIIFGFSAEIIVAAWRFKLPKVSRWKKSLQHILTNFVLAVGASAVIFVFLALPILDSVLFINLLVAIIFAEFLIVCSLAAFISIRRDGFSPMRSFFLRAFCNYILLNIVSMVVGVGFGRLYLIIFYPGVG